MNKRFRLIALTGALLTLVACKSEDKKEAPVTPAVTETTDDKTPDVAPETAIATTEAVIDHHLASFGAGKIDDILADYADDAVIVSPLGIFKGKDGMKPLFEGLIKEFSHADAKFTMGKKMVNGQLGFITWSAETAENTYELATDTFVVVEGKIVSQTLAAKVTPKKAPDAKAEAAKDEPLAESPTQAVLMHHLGAFGERKIDEILTDYTAESVLLSTMGEVVGADALKPVYEGLFAEFGKKGVKFEMVKMIVEGEIAMVVWTAKTPDNHYEWATDTFIIRDGKILLQTLAAKVTPAKG